MSLVKLKQGRADFHAIIHGWKRQVRMPAADLDAPLVSGDVLRIFMDDRERPSIDCVVTYVEDVVLVLKDAESDDMFHQPTVIASIGADGVRW